MSFTRDVKNELLTLELSPCCAKAQLAAIIALGANVYLSNKQFKIEYRTTSLAMIRFLVSAFKQTFGKNAEILIKERNQLDYRKVYYVVVWDEDGLILNELGIVFFQKQIKKTTPTTLFSCDGCKNSYLRGAFLAKGSLNDPNKSNYHLEIVCQNEDEANLINSLLEDFSLDPKIINRPKGYVVYLKKSENIGDFLKIVEATNSLFAFEDARIKRDLSNSINRVINCDLANTTRTIQSAQKQLSSIKIIEEQLGYEKLPTRLMEAIILRTTYPDYSLAELSEVSEEVLGRTISKSALNHCFRSINDLAERIKKNKS